LLHAPVEEIRFMEVDPVARRVLAEYEEMPGLRLTPRQAARLFGLDQERCRAVLDLLVDLAYLKHTSAGAVIRGDRVAA
jgi:hypothetical protein